MQGEIWRRHPVLVGALLGVVEEVGEMRLPELFAYGEGLGKWGAKTVENTVRDLASFGALRIVQRGRDRCAGMTILGLAWLAQEVLPRELPVLRSAVVALLEEAGVDWHESRE